MALKYDLLIDKGATYVKLFTWFDPPPNPNPNKLTHGDPKDLTGYTGKLQARLTPSDTTPLFTIDSADGGIIILNGTITIRIEAYMTDTFTFEVALYDLRLTSPSGDASRLIEGKLKVSPNITR